MRPWLINTFIIIGVLIIIGAAPLDVAREILGVIVFVTSVWAAMDANKLDVKKYQTSGLQSFSSPTVTFIACFLLWIFVFPLYISFRRKLKDGKIPLKAISTAV